MRIYLVKNNIDGKETCELGFNDEKYCGKITDNNEGTLRCIYNGLISGQLKIQVNKIDTKVKKGK